MLSIKEILNARPHRNGGGMVATSAYVHKTAYVHRTAYVADKVTVLEHATIGPGAVLRDNVTVIIGATVVPNAVICGYTLIENETFDFGSGSVPAYTWYNGNGWVAQTAKVHKTAYIGPYAQVFDTAVIEKDVRIEGKMKIGNNIVIHEGEVVDESWNRVLNILNNMPTGVVVNGNEVIIHEGSITKNSLYFDTKNYFNFGEGLVSAHRHKNGGGWVANTAEVHETAYIDPEARVYGEAVIHENAVICYGVTVKGDTNIHPNRVIGDDHCLEIIHNFGFGLVRAHQHLNGGGWVADSAKVDATSYIGPRAKVFGKAVIEPRAMVTECAKVFGDAVIHEDVKIGKTTWVYGRVEVPKGATLNNSLCYAYQCDLALHDFGLGLVPAHRHRKGGGWVADTACVDESAIVHATATVYDQALVGKNVVIRDGAKVFGDAFIDEGAVIQAFSETDKSLHDFGYGLVPAHRHCSGGGWVADTAYVDKDSYVGPDAIVFDNAKVIGNSRITEQAAVYGSAIFINAVVSGTRAYCGDVLINGHSNFRKHLNNDTRSQCHSSLHDFGNGLVPAHRHKNGGGWVTDTANVTKNSYVGPNALVFDNAIVYGRVENFAKVYGHARIGLWAQVKDYAHVYGNARLGGNSQAIENAQISGNVKISGTVTVKGITMVDGNVSIHSNEPWSMK